MSFVSLNQPLLYERVCDPDCLLILAASSPTLVKQFALSFCVSTIECRLVVALDFHLMMMSGNKTVGRQMRVIIGIRGGDGNIMLG